MNRFLKILAAIVLVPVAIFVPVLIAQTISLDSQVYAQSNDTLQQRVEKYKSQLKETPSRTDLDKTKLKCETAQGTLKKLSSRIGTAKDSRTKVYDFVTERLNNLVTVLKEKNVDTTELESEIEALQAKIDTFKADVATYKQAADDSTDVKCQDDTLAFESALTEVRDKNTALGLEVADIRHYINDTIKPTLKQIRADLVAQKQATDGTTDDTSTISDGTTTTDGSTSTDATSTDTQTGVTQ